MALPLNMQSGMPQMKAAFSGWQINITLVRIVQTIVDGFVTDTETAFTFRGTVQPLSADEIELKPVGQRSWAWWQVHCLAGASNLVTNDRIIFNGLTYKVMAIKDYSLNNYIEYHVILDFQGAPDA